VVTLGAPVSLFGKKSKSSSPSKMKALKVEFGAKKASKKSSKPKAKSKASEPMDFAAWVDHYVEMSKGNPV
jgi:hypothetical protein